MFNSTEWPNGGTFRLLLLSILCLFAAIMVQIRTDSPAGAIRACEDSCTTGGMRFATGDAAMKEYADPHMASVEITETTVTCTCASGE